MKTRVIYKSCFIAFVMSVIHSDIFTAVSAILVLKTERLVCFLPLEPICIYISYQSSESKFIFVKMANILYITLVMCVISE